MTDKLSRAEIRKDAVQDGFTAATHTVGTVVTIITGAVGDVGRAVGGFATELFEIRDSARRAGQDHERPSAARLDEAPEPPGGPVDVQ